ALRKGGVLEGAVFDVWPRAAGLVRSGWMFTGIRPPTGAELDAFFERHPWINGAPSGLDWLFPHVWGASDAETRTRALAVARDLGAPPPVRHFTSTDFPPSPADDLSISALDWRLVTALRRSPTRSLAAVAKS